MAEIREAATDTAVEIHRREVAAEPPPASPAGPRAWKAFRPRWERLLLAFVAAPAAASFFLSLALAEFEGRSWEPDLLLAFALTFSLPGAFVFGGPLYALLIGRVKLRIPTAMAAGACIGVIVFFLSMKLLFGGSEQISGNPVAFARREAPVRAILLGSGGFGGLVFWLCAVWRDPGQTADAAAEN
ncbi:MAG: hypothetical protein FWD68_12200 [Alphaproteobacteria bacterium]|nr:hypothetical protein [Alphaproteobacteria bacterium]